MTKTVSETGLGHEKIAAISFTGIIRVVPSIWTYGLHLGTPEPWTVIEWHWAMLLQWIRLTTSDCIQSVLLWTASLLHTVIWTKLGNHFFYVCICMHENYIQSDYYSRTMTYPYPFTRSIPFIWNSFSLLTKLINDILSVKGWVVLMTTRWL